MANPKPSRLGKGLDGLLARTDESGTKSPTLQDIPLRNIRPNPKQPRQNFDEDELAELAESIKAFGLLQPVVVRPNGGSYELIMGERRLRASELAGLQAIPAIVRPTEDNALLRDALLENLHRSDLNPIEEAMAYQQLLEEFGCTKEELSTRIRRSRPQISNTLRLLNLPTAVQVKVAAGVLSAGHAKALLGLLSPDEQRALAERIIVEGLSVRTTEEIVALGAGRRRSSSPRGPRQPSERERELAGQLSDHFDTRVKVDIGRNKGKITIEFATGEDLERIMAIIEGKTISY
ncbi:ParB/RepB/Spo0J family partition protein [Tessaracoccus sp. OH4464_COT-324]|uniref:ParB/RepB/Spo0J family partition protein n=1 Tax=Tessaracoccus sp. OH4464_COT-324 TaxID=2491059 RepID=UPI000F62EA8A|nr:ParB/RepB/Spo0J family partition protein [Tessaracoccus sp. OH4464_COT-324]RRD46121.1 ParB/RepB/Spo0J family partition protein [Tessaracoccus sp. OH4464_COT-324]